MHNWRFLQALPRGLQQISAPSQRSGFDHRNIGRIFNMSTAPDPKDMPQYHIQAYTPRHSKFPYSKADLTPSDTSPAPEFYTMPRYVAHIDNTAISALQKYYAHHLLPQTSSTGPQRVPRVLDICTSHLSHLPPSLEAMIQQKKLWMAGIGMNASELQRNHVLNGGWQVSDLDAEPHVGTSDLLRSTASDRGQIANERSKSSPQERPLEEEQKLDASTCVVSADYLRRPVAVLSSLRQATRINGTVHLVVSNRCFPTKAVSRWLRVGEAERLQMCGDYLWWAGWRDVEIVTLHDGSSSEEQQHQQQTSRVAQLLRGLGMPGMHSDPLWVVRGRNTGEAVGSDVPDDV